MDRHHRHRHPYRARTVVAASGPLADASLPAMRGIDTYKGKKIHSARWDHDYDLAGKRVAVIGTGASAVQIVPELVRTAATVKVFQRTAGLGAAARRRRRARTRAGPVREGAGHPAGGAARAVPRARGDGDRRWCGTRPPPRCSARAARAYLHHEVKDPWLRRQLTPDFRPGCKRMLVSSD